MALRLTDRYFDRPSFERLVEGLDPQWIEDALAASGTATMRRRRLPAEQAVWLVLGMALYRGMSIVEIVEHLQLALPDSRRATFVNSQRKVIRSSLRKVTHLSG